MKWLKVMNDEQLLMSDADAIGEKKGNRGHSGHLSVNTVSWSGHNQVWHRGMCVCVCVRAPIYSSFLFSNHFPPETLYHLSEVRSHRPLCAACVSPALLTECKTKTKAECAQRMNGHKSVHHLRAAGNLLCNWNRTHGHSERKLEPDHTVPWVRAQGVMPLKCRCVVFFLRSIIFLNLFKLKPVHVQS